MTVNPTSDTLSFKWKKAGTNEELSFFECLTPSGVIKNRKIFESQFSFYPQSLGLFETFYSFEVKESPQKTLFLLVGNAREPCVYFSKPCLKLKPTIKGIEIKDEIELVNEEDEDFPFKFSKETLFADGREQKVEVEPSEGVVKGNTKQIIK